jgi:hypothetical protein
MIALLYYLFILFQIGFILYLFYFSLSFIKGAPYVPSKKRTAEIMINFAHIKPGMMVYDLGSGDGRLLFLAAKRGATAIGYDIISNLSGKIFGRRILKMPTSYLFIFYHGKWTDLKQYYYTS